MRSERKSWRLSQLDIITEQLIKMSSITNTDTENPTRRSRAYASKEDVLISESNGSIDSILNEVTPQEKKKIPRKIDWRVTILVGILWCITLIDRANLGNASIAGSVIQLIYYR